MGMMGGLGMMAGNPLSAMQSIMAMRSPGLDMSNPVIAQIMMQQVSLKFSIIIFFTGMKVVYTMARI